MPPFFVLAVLYFLNHLLRHFTNIIELNKVCPLKPQTFNTKAVVALQNNTFSFCSNYLKLVDVSS